jgi:predicted membrane channel-forming protein YqfA (hemolysin III family)
MLLGDSENTYGAYRQRISQSWGRQGPQSTYHSLSDTRQSYYGSQILYVLVLVLIKISILTFYLRIFPDDFFRLLTKIAIVFTALCGVGFSLAMILQCLPIAAVWDPSIKDAKCVNSTRFIISGTAISLLQDIIVIVLPIPQLMALHLTLRKRVALISLFALGSL